MSTQGTCGATKIQAHALLLNYADVIFCFDENCSRILTEIMRIIVFFSFQLFMLTIFLE